jgi:hypothetical protein
MAEVAANGHSVAASILTESHISGWLEALSMEVPARPAGWHFGDD